MYMLDAEEYVYNMLPFIWGNRDMTYIHTHTYTSFYICLYLQKETQGGDMRN